MAATSEEIEHVYHARYGGFRRALAALVGVDAAHDAVQEGFAQALARRSRFRGGSLEAWIWRIVVRKAYDERRRRRPSASLDEALDPALVESEHDPELAAAIRGLPPRRRLIVFLRYFADLSYAEIAELTGIREGTVAAVSSLGSDSRLVLLRVRGDRLTVGDTLALDARSGLRGFHGAYFHLPLFVADREVVVRVTSIAEDEADSSVRFLTCDLAERHCRSGRALEPPTRWAAVLTNPSRP